MLKKTRLKKRKDIVKVEAELGRLWRKNKGSYWSGEEFVAFHIWEVMLTVHAMARQFLEDPTPEGWRNVSHWLLDLDTHYNSLRNLAGKSKRELGLLAKHQPAWLMFVPLEDI